MEIRKIRPDEMSTAISLIEEVFLEFEAPDYSEAGIRAFKETAIYNTEFMHSLAIYGAYIDTSLAGIIATRNEGQHIALYFVDSKHHRQGIGTLLFQHVLGKSPTDEITVNSSPYAVEIYHHLGFIDTAPEQETDGIKFTPMIYKNKSDIRKS